MEWTEFFKEVTEQIGEVIETSVRSRVEGTLEGDFSDHQLSFITNSWVKEIKENYEIKTSIIEAVKNVIWDDKYDIVVTAIEDAISEIVSIVEGGENK